MLCIFFIVDFASVIDHGFNFFRHVLCYILVLLLLISLNSLSNIYFDSFYNLNPILVDKVSFAIMESVDIIGL